MEIVIDSVLIKTSKQHLTRNRFCVVTVDFKKHKFKYFL